MCIYLELKNINIERYFDKYKCEFNIKHQSFNLKDYENLELNILKKIENKNLSFKLSLKQQFESGLIKFYSNNSPVYSKELKNGIFMLKISGIWSSKNEYGITYKFIPIKFNHPF